MPNPRFEAMVAIAQNGVIGKNQGLPWRLKSDLIRFKNTTMGHSLLMGRKTYESIGRPLPGRRTWILTRQTSLEIPGCSTIQHWETALENLHDDEKLFLVGGAEIYQQLLEFCGALHITHVLADVTGDATLPPINTSGYHCVERVDIPADENNEWPSRYEKWVA